MLWERCNYGLPISRAPWGPENSWWRVSFAIWDELRGGAGAPPLWFLISGPPTPLQTKCTCCTSVPWIRSAKSGRMSTSRPVRYLEPKLEWEATWERAGLPPRTWRIYFCRNDPPSYYRPPILMELPEGKLEIRNLSGGWKELKCFSLNFLVLPPAHPEHVVQLYARPPPNVWLGPW